MDGSLLELQPAAPCSLNGPLLRVNVSESVHAVLDAVPG